MSMRMLGSVAAVLGLLSPAQAGDCRLALVLALDVSSSVSDDEDWLQREGLARALVTPEVRQAFLARGPVALFAFEWSGPNQQMPILPWQMITSLEDLARASASISSPRDDTPRLHHETAVGSALAFAATALKAGPDCWAQTVDVSSDGINSAGAEPRAIYEWPQFRNVTVNALVIGGASSEQNRPVHDALVTWFEDEVLHGPGAFCILARGYQDYERAMSAKLRRELEVPVVSGGPAEAHGRS
jgi:hypothetical protein